MEDTNPNELLNAKKKITAGWGSLSKTKRIGLVTIVSVILVVGLVYTLVLNNTEYTSIYTNLDVQTAGEVKALLEENGITDYKIGEGGTSILVKKQDVDRIRMDLAVNGFSPTTGTGYELFDSSSLGMTEEERQIMYQRALEGELKRSIESLDVVNEARVHLNLIKETVFMRDPAPSSASIVLDLRSNAQLSDAQVQGIIALATGAVNNLAAENVQVIDTAGNLLSKGVGLSSGYDSGERITQELNYEVHLEDKVRAQLGKVLGYDAIAVSVRVNLNQTSQEEIKEDYEDGPVVSEQTNFNRNDSTTGEAEGGGPLDNNIGNVIDGETTDEALQDSSIVDYNNTTNYQPDKTETHTVKPPGEIEKITVSVIYNGDMTEQLNTMIQQHVSSIVGVDVERGDVVSVAGIEFNSPVFDGDNEIVNPGSWLTGLSTFEYFLYGTIIASVMMALIFFVFKRKPKEEYEADINGLPYQTMPSGYMPYDQTGLEFEDEETQMEIHEPMIDLNEQLERYEVLLDEIKMFFDQDMSGGIDLIRAWLNEERIVQDKKSDVVEYDGIDKAARLLITLGKTLTADVMKFLSNEEVIRLAHIIATIQAVPHNQMYPIIEEFSQMMEAKRFMSQGGYDFAREALVKALGTERTEEVMFKIKSTTRQRRPFDVVRKMEPMQLLNALMDEHPQTIALVLCYLPADKAAKIISELPEALQSDVAMRIGLMNNTSSQIVEAVESVIETRLQSLVMGDMTHIGGLNTVVDILNAVDRTTQKQIINKLSEENPKLAEEVRDNLFTFEDIVILDKVAVQRVIREVDQNKLALALKGASDTVNNLIMSNISVRAAEKLKEEIDYLGPVRLLDVELAQQEIVNIIRRLEDTGEIVISRGEESDVIY